MRSTGAPGAGIRQQPRSDRHLHARSPRPIARADATDCSGDWLYAPAQIALTAADSIIDDGCTCEVPVTALCIAHHPTANNRGEAPRQWLRREAELLLPDLRAALGIAWQATITHAPTPRRSRPAQPSAVRSGYRSGSDQLHQSSTRVSRTPSPDD